MSWTAILVTGDRHATETTWTTIVRHALTDVTPALTDAVLIHGNEKGIDRIADLIGRANYMAVIPVPAMGARDGTAAVPGRNAAMLDVLGTLRDQGYTVMVLAFHDRLGESKGTGGCVREALRRGLPVRHYTSDGGRFTVQLTGAD